MHLNQYIFYLGINCLVSDGIGSIFQHRYWYKKIDRNSVPVHARSGPTIALKAQPRANPHLTQHFFGITAFFSWKRTATVFDAHMALHLICGFGQFFNRVLTFLKYDNYTNRNSVAVHTRSGPTIALKDQPARANPHHTQDSSGILFRNRNCPLTVERIGVPVSQCSERNKHNVMQWETTNASKSPNKT